MNDGEVPGYPMFTWQVLDHGFRVYTGSKHVPPELHTIVFQAEEAGCRFVEFDCDVSPIDRYPAYEW